APAAPVPPTADLERVLLDVVAEKTGYPIETLALDMDLESDLGAASIKRVEILAGVQERAPDAPAVDPAHLGRLRTIRQIVEFIASRVTPRSNAPARDHGDAHAHARDHERDRDHGHEDGLGLGHENIERVLLLVVSEKTGYPLETLALDMDLE